VYASYFYVPGASSADVLNDIVAILTGTTDVNLLSASCDKTQTQIRTDYAQAGWTQEGSPSTGQILLSSPHSQDPARKKYLILDSSTMASGYLGIGSAVSYDPNTQTLSYSRFLANYQCPAIDLTNGGRLDVYADGKVTLFLSYVGGNLSDWSGVVELDLQPYDNKGHALISATTIYPAEVFSFSGTPTRWPAIPVDRFIGREPLQDGNTVEACRFLVQSASYKVLSEIPGVYELPDGFGAVFDTIVFPDNKTYVIWPSDVSANERVALPWG